MNLSTDEYPSSAAARDVPRVLRSPVFSKFAFPSGGATQYADAMLRTTFPKAGEWRTLLAKPEVKPVKIAVPVGYGYILTSKATGGSFAVVDVKFLQKELLKQLSKQEGKLVIALTHNTTYYADGDATECCSWGTHGVDSATQNSFVLGSYLHAAPGVVEDGDVQPLTQQLGEFVNDPLLHGRNVKTPGNIFPGRMRPASMRPGNQGSCGGTGVASNYLGGDPRQFFPPMPADKVAVGFLTGDTTPAIVSQAMDYIISGKAPAGTRYKLRQPRGYPGMIGAMFWTIDADRRGNYNFSNVVGPQLHGYPATR